jgi:transcriptional regulator with XRE-family HTH domain
VKAVEPIGRNLGRPSQQARKTDDLDLLIGRRLRERRILLAISQEELARRIGLSFQQLQKYEVGENRISAARLFKLSEMLAVPISWFFRPATGSRRTAYDTSASGESRFSADDGREISAAQQLKLSQ